MTKYPASSGEINVPADVAVGLPEITILTSALVAMRTTLHPKGALPLCALEPLLLMFSLLIIREASYFDKPFSYAFTFVPEVISYPSSIRV